MLTGTPHTHPTPNTQPSTLNTHTLACTTAAALARWTVLWYHSRCFGMGVPERNRLRTHNERVGLEKFCLREASCRGVLRRRGSGVARLGSGGKGRRAQEGPDRPAARRKGPGAAEGQRLRRRGADRPHGHRGGGARRTGPRRGERAAHPVVHGRLVPLQRP